MSSERANGRELRRPIAIIIAEAKDLVLYIFVELTLSMRPVDPQHDDYESQ
jgi:hypothetical protein